MFDVNEKLMRLAVRAAKKGKGKVSPNPLVGAVIVKDGSIISIGWHNVYGDIHAEKMAIENAGDIDFSDATIYVNLEPCTHYGKQPPCAPLLIEKKFKSVVVGTHDPNPLVAGKGLKMLRDAGIEVVDEVLVDECRWLNRFFFKNISDKMPYTILKLAQSLNGCIATQAGESKWITGPESRKRVHQLRAEVDGIIIGKNTAKKDNPTLNVRLVEGRDPYRIIFDTNLNCPPDLKMFDIKDGKSVIICGDGINKTKIDKFKSDSGVLVYPVDMIDGRINAESAMAKLSEELNIASVMIEGGAVLASSFLSMNLIDEIHLFIAPKIILGGIQSIYELNITEKLADAKQYKMKGMQKSGEDLEVICTKM